MVEAQRLTHQNKNNSDKQYYLNKKLKHFSNKFIGQMEVNTYTEIVIGLKGSGKTAFIGKLRKDLAQHWRVCVIDALDQSRNIADTLLHEFELRDPENPIDNTLVDISTKEILILNRLRQAIQLGLKIYLFIDHAENLTRSQLEQLLPYFQAVKLVFFATPEFKDILEKNPDLGFFHRSHIMAIDLLEADDVIKFLKRRLSNIAYQGRFPFSDEDIDKIFLISKGNPYLIKILSNHLFERYNIPLPAMATNKDTFGHLKNSISLPSYTNVKSILEVEETHKKIREIPTPQDSQSRPRSWKKLIWLPIALIVIIATYQLFSTGFLENNFPANFWPKNAKNILHEAENNISITKKAQTPADPQTNNHTFGQTPNILSQTPVIPVNSEGFTESSMAASPQKIEKHENIQSPDTIPAPTMTPANAETVLAESLASIREIHQSIITDDTESETEKQPVNHDVVVKNNPTSSKTSKKSILLGHQWLYEQADHHYTIQLLGSKNYKKLLKTINKSSIDLPVAVIAIKKNSKIVWYSAIAGSFKTKQAAILAIKKFPKKLKKNKPWPRSFAIIKNQI